MASAAGENERASSLFERAIALYERAGDTHAAARAAGWLALAEQRLGRPDEGIARMERAHAIIGEDEPDADLAFLLARLGMAHFFAGNPEQAAERTERALDLAEALQLPEILVRGWTTKATINQAERPNEARGLFQLALDTALAHDLRALASTACGNLSELGFRGDRYGESLAYLEQELELTRRFGNRQGEWFALSEMTYALFMLGRWDEALARLAELPDEQLGTHTLLLSPLTGVLELHLHRGQPDSARRLLHRYDELARSATSDVQMQSVYQSATPALRLAEGDPRAALTAAEQALAVKTALGTSAQPVKQAFPHALEAALALGEREKANELLRTVEELPPGLRPPYLAATAHRFRARLAGTDPSADQEFTTATSQLRELELPFHLAVVQLEHGEWLLARGRPDDAQPLLAEARETFAHLDAKPWLQRLSTAEAIAPAEMPA